MSGFRTRFACFLPFGVALLAALFVALIPSTSVGAQPQYVLRLADAVDEAHPYNVGAREFAEKVAERSGGQIRIDLYPNGQLGAGEREEVEALQFGAIDLVVTGTAVLANFLPDFQVMDLPFLFRDYGHVDAVLDGPVGQELLDRLNSAGLGMVGLSLWEQGFRHLTNGRRPIESPADVRGLKIRVQENPIHVDSFNALGAQATPMSWGEVYTALEQGVIDGQENPIPVLTSHRIYEVQPYGALTGHFYSPAIILINDRLFQGMEADLQQILVETAREVSRSEREAARQMEQEQVAELEALGMEFTRPENAPFQQAMTPVYDKYRSRFGDLVERILQAGQ